MFLAGGVAGLTAAAASPAPAMAQDNGGFEMPRGMTLLTFQKEGRFQLGVRMSQGILDVRATAASSGLPVPADMDDLLQNGKGALLRRLVEAAPAPTFLREEALTFGPGVTRPEKIILIGHNYKRHVEEVKAQLGKDSVLFNKYNTAPNAQGGGLGCPSRSRPGSTRKRSSSSSSAGKRATRPRRMPWTMLQGTASATTSARVTCSD
jgi:hypothetical protein